MSIASGSPTSLISATLVRPWAYNINSLGVPTRVTVEAPLTARIVSGAPSAAAEPRRSRTTQQLESAPHPLLDLVVEVPRSLRGVPSSAYVFVVDEEFGGVRSLVDPGNRKDRESGRTSADPVNQFGEFPPLLDFGYPALVQAGQRFGNDAARPNRIRFAHPKMSGEVVRIPALAESGCLRSDLVKQVAQLSPFGPGKRHERPS
jgi:hypothetical protein